MNDAEKKSLMEIKTKSFRLEIYERSPLIEGFVSSLSDWVKGKSEDREEEAPDKKKPKKLIEEGKRKKRVSSAVMSSDHRLKKYGTTSVYKPILDFILERASEPFTATDVSSLIEKYYTEVLGRVLKESTQDLYADRYIRYMRKSDPPIVKRYRDPSVSPLLLCRRIKYVEEPAKIKKAEGSDIANDIYNLAKKEGWTDRKKQVNMASIKECLPRYNIDEIFSGITYLIKKDMVLQMSPDEVRF